MIELRHITKAYHTKFGPNIVLDDLNLTLSSNHNVGILGHNGAGKSTLLRVIGGAELPDLGEVVRHGQVSWPIGFAGGFNPSLSGEENCRFVSRIYSQDLDRVTDETQAFAEIGKYFYMPVRTYSSGMRARLAFGLSMAIDFDVYLVDEVTAVGDKAFRRKCKQSFADRSERASILMVSHNMNTLKEYCNRFAVLHHGHLKMYEDPGEAIAVYERVAG